MDFKKLIQVADVFGTETRKLADLKEGELADKLAAELGWSQPDADEVEQTVVDTGNDPDEMAQVIAPEAQTTAPAQPETPSTDSAPARPSTDNRPAVGIDADQPPERPQASEPETAPTADTTAPTAPQTDAENDADSADNAPQGDSAADVAQDDAARTPPQTDAENDADSADSGVDTTDDARAARTNAPQTDAELDADSADNAPQGDALAGRLDTTTPSLLDAYNSGGRRAMDSVRDLQTGLSRLGFDPNGIDGKYGRGTYAAVQEFQRQNGLQVDGEAGPATMAKLQELLNGGAGEEQPQGDSAADVAQDDAARTAPQTDAELDTDSADSGTPPDTSNAQLPGEPETFTSTAPQQPRVNGEVGVQSNGNIARGFNLPQFKRHGTYIDIPNQDGTVTRAYGRRSDLQRFIQDDRRGRGLTIQGGGATTGSGSPTPTDVQSRTRGATSQQAGVPDAERDGRERGVQTASKDFSMKKYIKESVELDECGPEMSMPQREGNPVTMSVTLNASGEEHVQDLIRMMQLAGAKDAAPVAAMHVGPADKHDDMVNMMRMMDTPEESVEEEWDNAPDEDYKDHKHMTKDLSGGLNREKKAYKAAQPGDNAMAVESIKDQLIQALEGKYANDAQRKAVHAAKADKKKK